MKVLFISDRQDGGILRHVRCLRACLPPEVETYEIGRGGNEEFAGRSGHDLREFWQICRVLKAFKPDIIHLHVYPLLMCLYLKLFTKIPRIASIHTSAQNRLGMKDRILHWLMKPCYYLPVSGRTWHGFKAQYPDASGEVFFNSMRIESNIKEHENNNIIGMVGRSDPDKGWPDLAEIARKTNLTCWGVGVSKEEAFARFGEIANAIEWKGVQPYGREWIGNMDVFVLTSKHEEMPTVVLEAFAERTAICGFIPEGGMGEILGFSNGPLREVFIKERDISRLAGIVMSLLNDEAKRKAVIEDGWQILVNHFDAAKNCRRQLIDIYQRLSK